MVEWNHRLIKQQADVKTLTKKLTPHPKSSPTILQLSCTAVQGVFVCFCFDWLPKTLRFLLVSSRLLQHPNEQWWIGIGDDQSSPVAAAHLLRLYSFNLISQYYETKAGSPFASFKRSSASLFVWERSSGSATSWFTRGPGKKRWLVFGIVFGFQGSAYLKASLLPKGFGHTSHIPLMALAVKRGDKLTNMTRP